jgi:hypothetical protein
MRNGITNYALLFVVFPLHRAQAMGTGSDCNAALNKDLLYISKSSDKHYA